MSDQLPLGIRLRPEVSFNSFVAGANREPLEAVRLWARGDAEDYIFVWGPRGTGKTHLLQAACNAVLRREQAVAYLSLSRIAEMQPEILEDLERFDFVCLDDVHRLEARGSWQQRLFDLFNRIREQGGHLLVSANGPAARLPLELPDLKSRLGWGPGYRLRPLDDDHRLHCLLQAAAQRGMILDPESGRYILHRCPRDLHSLMNLLDRLDRHSLAAQRRPTIPLVRQLLETS